MADLYQFGLPHRVQIPADMTMRVGDFVDVTILKVEAERGRISLGTEKS